MSLRTRSGEQWRGRIGLVAAALASLATSQLAWSISAPVTPEVVPEQKVYRYTVTASDSPWVRVTETRSGVGGVSGHGPPPSPSPSTWTGSQTVDVFGGS